MFFGEIEALADDDAEIFFVENQMVGRCDDHPCVGVFGCQCVGCIGDAGSRVAAGRFAQNLPFVQFGQMFQHERLVFVVGDDEEVFGRNRLREPFVGLTDERFARAQNIEKLLGHVLTASWPESGADTARHDDAVGGVRHGCVWNVFVRQS